MNMGDIGGLICTAIITGVFYSWRKNSAGGQRFEQWAKTWKVSWGRGLLIILQIYVVGLLFVLVMAYLNGAKFGHG